MAAPRAGEDLIGISAKIGTNITDYNDLGAFDAANNRFTALASSARRCS